MFKLHVLASGSKGNASVIEDTQSGQCVLIDCGISKRDFLSCCESVSVDPHRISDVLITHEHTDHTKGIGVVVRGLEKMGISLHLRTSSAIRSASPEIKDALKSENVDFIPIQAGGKIQLENIRIEPFSTSHDAVESFGFRFESCGGNGGFKDSANSKNSKDSKDPKNSKIFKSDSLVYLTDSGVVTEQARVAMEFARIVAIESNHDLDMLMHGSYPYLLKKRISSDTGHLSNNQAAKAVDDLLFSLSGASLECVVAMHVSQENNTYDLPERCLGDILAKHSHGANIVVAKQSCACSVG